MSEQPLTALGRYLRDHNLTQAEFGERIGCTQPAVARYVAGRVPERPVLERIVEATNGELTPNDFYGVPLSAAPRRKADPQPTACGP